MSVLSGEGRRGLLTIKKLGYCERKGSRVTNSKGKGRAGTRHVRKGRRGGITEDETTSTKKEQSSQLKIGERNRRTKAEEVITEEKRVRCPWSSTN